MLRRPLTIYPTLAALASGLLLWSAFPPLDHPGNAWFALAPLILAARGASSPRDAFRLGWTTGIVFWFFNLTWLWKLVGNGGPWPLVVLGHVGLSVYCALYLGLFAGGIQRMAAANAATPGFWRRLLVLAGEPLLWVGTEYLRATLFTGFSWNFLGVSQYRMLPLIQIADQIGVYGVSALLVLMNSGLADLLSRIRFRAGRLPLQTQRGFSVGLSAALAVLAVCGISGARRLQRHDAEIREWSQVRISLIQPNAPSVFERNPESIRETARVLQQQTRLAAVARPHLIVWPETAMPGIFPTDREALQFLHDLAHDVQTPILAGVVETDMAPPTHHRRDRQRKKQFFNSSWLYDPGPRTTGVYRKQHLVPFGEYIPFDRYWSALERLSPIGYSCTPGIEAVLLQISIDPEAPLTLSPLICFEDTMPYLSRRAVRAGARLLVNQTNDSWFDGSTEPLQHLAQAVFRAVETRTPMTRAANTGVSAVIDSAGRLQKLSLDGKITGFAGFMTQSVPVPPTAASTPYVRHGDRLFAIPAALFLAAVWIGILFSRPHD